MSEHLLAHAGNQKPKLYILNLMAVDQIGDSHLFLYTGVARTKQDAYLAALENMKSSIPELYAIGQRSREGFEIVSYKAIGKADIVASFNRVERPKVDLPRLKLVAHPAGLSEKNETAKSKLMQEIIERGSEEYLDSHRDKLSKHEIAYIRDRINAKQ